MKDYRALSIASAIVIALAGWLVGYLTAIRRDRLSKRRELRVQYLIEAFRRLQSSVNRFEESFESARELESAIADIQLFGSLHQAQLAAAFAWEFAAHGGANLDKLLMSLRADLRKELSLGTLDDPVIHLRVVPRKPDDLHS